MSLLLQRSLQDRLTSRELTLDRVDRDPSDGRELAVPEPVHVVQREQDARLARHRVQRARQVEPLDGRAAAAARRLLGGRAAATAQLVDADVREHAVEPRGHGPPALVRPARFERFQQRALDGVLRIGAIAEQAVGDGVQPGCIIFGGAGERALVHLEQLYAPDAEKGGRDWGDQDDGRAPRSAAQTLAAVSGTRVISTPRSASASSTALAIAGTGEMMPLSPTPLTPSSLRVEGKSSAITSSGGTWSALGRPYSISEPVTSWPAPSWTSSSASAAPIPWTIPP